MLLGGHGQVRIDIPKLDLPVDVAQASKNDVVSQGRPVELIHLLVLESVHLLHVLAPPRPAKRVKINVASLRSIAIDERESVRVGLEFEVDDFLPHFQMFDWHGLMRVGQAENSKFVRWFWVTRHGRQEPLSSPVDLHSRV